MMSSGGEQCADIKNSIRHGGALGKISVVFMVLSILMAATGFSFMIYGYSETRKNLDLHDHHDDRVPESQKHDGQGPFWVIGLVLCGAGAILLMLTMSICLCLCCFNYETSRGTKRMRQQEKTQNASTAIEPIPALSSTTKATTEDTAAVPVHQ